jgi:hypothetical protein
MPSLDKSVPIFESSRLYNQWHQAWSVKEQAIRSRLFRSCENLEERSRELPALREGDLVLIQNQDKSSGRPNKWDRQGKIIAAKPNDQYLIRVDGSGRLTLRNRRFLRKYSLRSATILDPQCSLHQRNQDGYVLDKDDVGKHTPTHSLSTGHGAGADQPAPNTNPTCLPDIRTDMAPELAQYVTPGIVTDVVQDINQGVTPGDQDQPEPDIYEQGRPRGPGRPPGSKKRGFRRRSKSSTVMPGISLRVAPSVPMSVVPDANPCAQPSIVPTTNHDATTDGQMRKGSSSRVHTQRTVYDASTGTQVEPAQR